MADIQSVLKNFKEQMAAEEAAKAAPALMPAPVVAPVPVAAAPVAPAVEAPKSEPISPETKQLFAQAILGLAPILAGAAVSGARGGAIGAEAGLAGLKKVENLQEQQRAQQRASQKLAQEQLFKNIDLSLRLKGEQRAQSKEERESLSDQRNFERQKQKDAFDQGLAIEKLGISKEELNLAKQKAARGEEQKLGKLTAQQTETLAGIDDAMNEINNIKDIVEKQKGLMGPVKQFKALFPGETASRVFDAQMKIAAQNIGKSLEGGKLTDADISRYRQMLPNLGDTPEVAVGKIENLQNLLASKKQTSLSVLEKANYDVTNFVPQKKSMSLPVGMKDAVAAPIPTKVIQKDAQGIEHEFILNPATGKYE